MDIYLKTCGAVLVALVLILTLGSKGKDIGILLSIAVCTMVILVAMRYLRPVVEFLEKLATDGGLDKSLIEILLKVVGISVVSEISALICGDSGNSSMGKSLQLLGTAVILWLSIPVFTMILELIQTMLGDI